MFQRADTGEYFLRDGTWENLLKRVYWGAFTRELIFGSIYWRADTGSISGELILGSIYWRDGSGEHLPES